jgi:hypothetical protein
MNKERQHTKLSAASITEKSLVWFMMFNATFNNISVISWRSVLLVDKTGVARENHQPVTSH